MVVAVATCQDRLTACSLGEDEREADFHEFRWTAKVEGHFSVTTKVDVQQFRVIDVADLCTTTKGNGVHIIPSILRRRWRWVVSRWQGDW